MFNRGKNTCKILKDIRRQIAEQNDIRLVIEECTYKGECLGTCPRCEWEVRYLEEQLEARRKAGKALKVAGISAAMVSMLAPSCAPSAKRTTPPPDTEGEVQLLEGDVVYIPDTIPEDEDSGTDSVITVLLVKEKNKNRRNTTSQEEPFRDVTAEISRIPEATAGLAPDEDVVFVVVEQMPQFPGGQEALFKYLDENKIEPFDTLGEDNLRKGRAIVQFVVNKEGNIKYAEVVRTSGNEECDKDALRVINSMPTWEPGKQRGIPTNVKYTVPITYKIPKERTEESEPPVDPQTLFKQRRQEQEKKYKMLDSVATSNELLNEKVWREKNAGWANK